MKPIKSLKHDYMWHKIIEMIEHDVKNDPNEEYKIDDSKKVNVCSQLAFCMSFLQNFSSCFKYFIYILLVIPAHTAGLERMFKNLKAMKSKARNRLSKKRTKKLMMIMNLIDDIEIDLDRIVQIYRSLQ